jgi:hypothetical protein
MQKLVYPVALAVLAGACSTSSDRSGTGFGTSPTAPSQVEAPGTGNVEVERVRVFVRDGLPQAYVEGPLGDGCTRLLPISQQRVGSTIALTVSSVREGEVCTMIMQFVNEWVPLHGIDTPGTYVVRANKASIEVQLVRGGDGGWRVEPDPGPAPEFPDWSTPGHTVPDGPPSTNPGDRDLPGSVEPSAPPPPGPGDR